MKEKDVKLLVIIAGGGIVAGGIIYYMFYRKKPVTKPGFFRTTIDEANIYGPTI